MPLSTQTHDMETPAQPSVSVDHRLETLIQVINAQYHFVIGGLIIGFSKSNSPKKRKMSESGRIIPLKNP